MKHNALMNMVLLRRSKFALKRAEAAVCLYYPFLSMRLQCCVHVVQSMPELFAFVQ